MEFRTLNTEELSALENTLSYASKIADKEKALGFKDVNELYKSFVAEGITDAGARIALGISFGHLFILSGKYEWVRITDEYGEETALAPHNKKIMIAPISMIQKRLDDNMHIDIAELYSETDKAVEVLIAKGEYQDR